MRGREKERDKGSKLIKVKMLQKLLSTGVIKTICDVLADKQREN